MAEVALYGEAWLVAVFVILCLGLIQGVAACVLGGFVPGGFLIAMSGSFVGAD